MKIDKRYLLLSLVLVFALSFIWSLGFALAEEATAPATTPINSPTTTLVQDGVLKSLWDAFFGGIFNSTGSFLDGIENNTNLMQWLLLSLVVLLIYSISDFVPLLSENKEWIKWGVSIIIGLLAFLFVDVNTIKSIVDTYSAVGVALTSVIPLLILMGFSLKVRENPKMGWFGPFIARFALVIFGLWLILKWNVVGYSGVENQYKLVYLSAGLVALVYAAIENKIWKNVFKLKNKRETQVQESEGAKDEIDHLKSKIVDLEERIKNDKNPKGLASRNKQRIEAIERTKEKIGALGGLVE